MRPAFRAIIKTLFIPLSFVASCLQQGAALPPEQSVAEEYRIFCILSGQNLNVSINSSEDSLLHLARRVEALARSSGNLGYEFKAGQVQVNTYCLQGNFGLAVSKAQQLIEKAHDIKDPLSLGVAIQAIGDNYMHSARYVQADSVFSEAAFYVDKYGDDFMRLQLMLQRLHVYSNLRDAERLGKGIEVANNLMKTNAMMLESADYWVQLRFYEAFYALFVGDDIRIQQLLAQIEAKKSQNGLWNLWYHSLATQYYKQIGEINKALLHSDSMMYIAERNNKNVFCQALLQRSVVLGTVGRDEEACSLYRQLLYLTDSLYKESYIAQIDSLHVSYWIDHLQMANLSRRNTLFTKVAVGLFIVVLMTIGIVWLIRRKNSQLAASRIRLEAMREASADSIHSKSLFLSNMSHELRTPLNAITGFASILTGDEKFDEQTLQDYCGYIRQNADLLMKLIGDVVDFSGLKGETIRFSFNSCDVVFLCRNVLQTVENIKRTQAKLHFITPLDKLEVVTDKNRLQQVLINLLVNATKFTKEGSIILRLDVDMQSDEAIFVVEDTGCGIPLEKQPRIFERFEKLHEGIQGAGLGLSICKLIVEHVSGRIWIDRDYTDGARFVFTHPLHFTPKEPNT